jgi:hypothetical protein
MKKFNLYYLLHCFLLFINSIVFIGFLIKYYNNKYRDINLRLETIAFYKDICLNFMSFETFASISNETLNLISAGIFAIFILIMMFNVIEVCVLSIDRVRFVDKIFIGKKNFIDDKYCINYKKK